MFSQLSAYCDNDNVMIIICSIITMACHENIHESIDAIHLPSVHGGCLTLMFNSYVVWNNAV